MWPGQGPSVTCSAAAVSVSDRRFADTAKILRYRAVSKLCRQQTNCSNQCTRSPHLFTKVSETSAAGDHTWGGLEFFRALRCGMAEPALRGCDFQSSALGSHYDCFENCTQFLDSHVTRLYFVRRTSKRLANMA